VNNIIVIMSGLNNFSYHCIIRSSPGSTSSTWNSTEITRSVHNSTLSPVTLGAPLLNVFNEQFIVSFSIT